jgi:hypothetical protein
MLIGMIISVFLRQIIPSQGIQRPKIPYIIPSLLHVILSFIGMIPALFLPETSRNEIERKLMPLMYIGITLTNIPFLVYITVLHGGVSNLVLPARIYLFAVLYSFMLMLFMGLFHLGINTSKITQFTLLGAAGCMLIVIMAPLSISAHPLEPNRWITDNTFSLLPLMMSVLAVFNYVALYIREKTQHILFRSGSISLVIIGHFLYLSRINTATVWIGILLFAAGIVIGIPRGRFSQLQ